MCGIAAILLSKPADASALIASCKTFSNRMEHRGPDDAGYVFFRQNGDAEMFVDSHSHPDIDLPNVETASGEFVAAFVHRRLSIVGLGAAGHQPMQSTTGRFWICFNGEIFNFKALNAAYNFPSKTGTDTETLLNLWEQKGEKSLELLDGFFAGIIYDAEFNKYTVFRDTTGVKPLFFAAQNSNRFFCSDTRALREVTGYNSVNPISIFHLLAEGILGDAENTTMFSGIREHKAGAVGHITNEEGYVAADWNLDKMPETPIGLREKLERSMDRRLIADVPLGFAVSGGLDSAAIIGLARKKLGNQASLKLFSITSKDSNSDERHWQKSVADFNHGEWISQDIEDAPISSLQNLIEHVDMPAVAWNNIAHFNLCKLAKENGVTVLFNGQGADEIFGGYPDYLQRDWWKIKSLLNTNAANWPISMDEIKRGWLQLNLISKAPQFLRQKQFVKKFQGLIHPDLLGHPSYAWSLSKMGADEKMKEDYFGKKLWQMLQWEDRNGMANSLESRNPFADDRALASFLKLPLKKKIENGFTKGMLRDVLSDVVPLDVLWRVDKKGFTVPDAALTWRFVEHWKPVFMSSVLDAWSPRKSRELLLKNLDPNQTQELKWFFRLVSLCYFLQNLEN